MVTGFLGPNGSGKSTTMRLILGLHVPSSGCATVNGTRYSAHKSPLRDVGVLLEARAVHPGRSAYDHLLAQALTQGIPRARVNELVEFVGLQDVAKKRVGQFSLGMGQRLGIASALLGDPATLILDEPTNGLARFQHAGSVTLQRRALIRSKAVPSGKRPNAANRRPWHTKDLP